MRAQRGNILTNTKHASPAPVILGLVPRILWQRVSNLVNKLALLLHKYWFTQDSWDKPKNDGCLERGFSLMAREQRSVAVGNKVMDTSLPQPVGCGDKYDVSGLCLKRLLSAFCMFFKYPSPAGMPAPSPSRGEGWHRPWCHKILGTDCASQPRMTSGRDANFFGRSMIEMLGVLAIIGVLSVGGIAGYSKAMQKWKINKTVEGYSMLVYGMLEHLEDLRKSTAAETNIDTETLLAINAIPKSWVNKNNNLRLNIVDSYNNQARVWLHKGYIIIDIYLSAPAANDKGGLVTENNSVALCRELFTNLFLPLHATAAETSVYVAGKHSYSFFGDKYCVGDTERCMSNATPVQINEACNTCGKTGDLCNFNILF